MVARITIAAAICTIAAKYSNLMIGSRCSICDREQRRQKEPQHSRQG